MQALNTYTNDPQFALTQPTATTIALAAVATTFGGPKRHYSARTLTIPAPTVPTWYYVTIADDDQVGESGPTLMPTCEIDHTLCGELGNTYMGAILALPAGGETPVLPGGWPAPHATLVCA
jgi:hypothetical protein